MVWLGVSQGIQKLKQVDALNSSTINCGIYTDRRTRNYNLSVLVCNSVRQTRL